MEDGIYVLEAIKSVKDKNRVNVTFFRREETGSSLLVVLQKDREIGGEATRRVLVEAS